MTDKDVANDALLEKSASRKQRLPTIRFSHLYSKMPPCIFSNSPNRTWLVGVSVCDVISLPKDFLDWDTEYFEGGDKPQIKHYELPKGSVLVLTLFTQEMTDDHYIFKTLWTTIRRWTPQKEIYYNAFIGSEVVIT